MDCKAWIKMLKSNINRRYSRRDHLEIKSRLKWQGAEIPGGLLKYDLGRDMPLSLEK